MDVEVTQQRARSTHSPTTQAAGPWVESSRRGDPSSCSQPSLTTQCGSALTRRSRAGCANACNELNKRRQAPCKHATTALGRGRKVKAMKLKNQRIRGQKTRRAKKVAPLVPVPSCANKAAPAPACPRRQPMRRRALCGVACAVKTSRTVEVRSSPQGNQSLGLRTDAVEAQMAEER